MNGDEDIARLLPEPPPPRPARRDATIALAMRRFDGDAAPSPAATATHARPGRSFAWGPTGALASILLVALIGIPIALRNPGGDLPRPEQRQPPAAEYATPGALPSEDIRPAGKPANPAIAKPQAPAAATQNPKPVAPGIVADAAEAIVAGGPAREVASPPPPPPAPSPPPAPAPAPASQAKVDSVVAADIGALPVTARRAPAQAMAASSAFARAAEEAPPGDDNVVVTGTRVSRARTAPARGGWNACTIADPERSLRRCPGLTDTDAEAARGTPASPLAQGLQRGWQGDWNGAIAAFDRALAREPKLAAAWLNRGLAHRQKGDLARAEADLDRAIRYAPHAARGYYHRSLVRQARGDARRARADAARARRLDPRFEAVIAD